MRSFPFLYLSIAMENENVSFRLNLSDGVNLVEDTDVADERHRLRNENSFILRIENLTKYFRKAFGENLAAVNGVSVGIKSGEVC